LAYFETVYLTISGGGGGEKVRNKYPFLDVRSGNPEEMQNSGVEVGGEADGIEAEREYLCCCLGNWFACSTWHKQLQRTADILHAECFMFLLMMIIAKIRGFMCVGSIAHNTCRLLN
jgi:hypothetical protein